MKLSLATLTYLAWCGKATLQIPQYSLELGSLVSEEGTGREIPDDWICSLNPKLPSRSGFWYLTSKGYQNLKKDLEKAWNAALAEGRTDQPFSYFHEQAVRHFKELEANIEKEKSRLKKKIQKLDDFVI